jgi:histidine triad (HIT) family protein
MATSSCVFCSIISGKLPKAILYEDRNILVLMDKYPINVGHTLVIPKIHYDNLLLMPPSEVGKLYAIIPVIAKAVIRAVKADGFNVGQNNGRAANQIVPHVHVHIIPRFKEDSPDGTWPVRHVADNTELIRTANKIKLELNLTLKSDFINNIWKY